MYQALDSYLVLFGLKEACYFFPGVLGRFIHYFGKMSFSVTFCLLLLVLCSSFSIGRGVWFSAEVQKLLDEILEEYSTCADHYRYDSVINAGLENSRRLPKIFIWCPLQHNRVRIQCPVHHCQLTFHRWTSHVVGDNSCNPRLVYDLDGNIVLVQAFYVCPRGDRFLSASKEILNVLPSPIKDSFPFRMSHRSACSNRLLDYLITSLTMGHSFLDITESILDINYRAFYRIHGTDSTASFHESSLYSSPSNDKLMQIFLSYYEQIKVSLDNFFLATRCHILSCDHTSACRVNFRITGNQQFFHTKFVCHMRHPNSTNHGQTQSRAVKARHKSHPLNETPLSQKYSENQYSPLPV